jgi:hypothetical protein
MGKARYVAKRRIPQPQLDTSEIGAMNTGLFRQPLLGQVPSLAQFPYGCGEIPHGFVLEAQAS